MEKPYWEGKHYAFFSNKECEYFPCHAGADPENFNCLFCYCPLYALGDKCGGNFKYNEKGFKDCTNCQLPHKKKNYGYVTGKYQELVFTDMNVILKNAQMASDLITECYKKFNDWFTQKYSKLIGTDDCMVDGDDFRKSLSAWRKSLPEAQKEEISIMEDIIMDIIDSSKKGKIYGKIKQVVK